MREEVYKSVSRIVSVIVVLNMSLGGFIGLMLIEKSANTEAAVSLPPKVGDTITINDLRIIQGSDLDDGTLDADWNLVISGGAANLTLIDTTLIFQSDTTHRYSISVTGGGKLCLINSTITVQTKDRFDNYETVYWFSFTTPGPNPTLETNFRRLIPFDITINGGQLMMFDNSALEYEGKLTITNSKTDIYDSVITSPSAPYSTHDWGVVVDIDSCSGANRVVIADTKIDKSPWFQGISYYDPDGPGPAVTMYDNHTITSSEVYFINTYIDLDYRNKSTPSMYKAGTDNHFPPNINPNHNALNIVTSTVKFVGLTIDMSETGDMIPNDGSTSIEVIGGGSTVALYRWLRVYPVDNKSVPLANAQVDISTIYTGDATINNLNNINNNVPVRDYIAANTDCTLSMVGTTIRAVTGISGKAVFALLSDLLTNADWPNSDQRDGYNILATYLTYTEEGLVDFENFPRVFPEDNYVDFFLDPFGISVPHPELYPEFVTVPSSSTLNGTTVNISVKVYNALIGLGEDATNVKVQFWDGNPELNSSSKINEQNIASLPKGTNVTLYQNWFATPPGAHNIYVGVDRDWEKPLLDNVIPEENENNNVIKATITVLDRPDLFINGSLIYFNPDDVVVNGTAVTVNAKVQNIGGSTASNVVVNFYDGTATGPSTFIGSNVVTVAPGSQITASVGWGPNEGFHYVWVILDENDVILESDETNNIGSQSIDVKSKPNLNPTIVFNPSSPQYEGTVITIQAVVANSGGWNVTKPVTVMFYGPNDQDLLLGSKTIELDFENVAIEAGGQETVSITWTATYPPAADTFYVVVDPDDTIDESNEADNTVSAVFTVNPRPNLKIASSDITISDHYPMVGENVVITMKIWNTGLSQVNTPFWVRIWLDDVGTGTLLNEFMETSTIASGAFINRNYNWNGVSPDGHHNLWVVVDYNNTVAETSESDNAAAGMIVIFKVPSDLIVNDATLYPPNPMGQLTLEDYWDSSDPYIRDGNTLVEQSGTLIVRNSIFKVVGETRDYEFTIVVKDNGNLIIDEGSFLTTEQFKVNLYLFDNAELYITGSTVDSMVDIIAKGNSRIYITENSAIYGNIYANDAGSTIYIQAINSTFTNKLLYIGANTQLDLWGVYIAGFPASDSVITVSDSAKVYIDWFLTVNVVDVNNEAIAGAKVMWYRSPPWRDTAILNSNSEGKALFRLRGMNITAAGVVSDIGSYKVVSDFTSPYTALTYYPDANVTLEMNQNKQKTIKFSSVKPDLDPPLWVTYSGSVISVGDTVTVHAYVNNTGPATAVDVRVTFDDDTTEGGWPVSFINASIPPGGSWLIQFEWKPGLVGWHNISIWVDPSNFIIEEDEGNNYNQISVYVTPQKADLTLGSADIWFTYTATGPTENDTVTIHANIRNIGETLANPTGGVEVKYYSDWPAANTFLGFGNISSISPGQTRESTFAWKSTSPSRTFQITVVVDEIGVVEETNNLNNSASKTIYIKKYPDIAPVGVEFYVQGSPVLSVTDSTQVTLTATVINVGETDAYNVQVQFFDGDPGLGGTQIGSTRTIALLAAYTGSDETSVTWVSTVTGKSQEHTIFVTVSGITENIMANNSYNKNITVTLRPILSVTDIWFSDESPFEGQEITIYATVHNTGGTDAIGFYVGFWDGDPDANASQIGVYKPLTVAVDSSGTVDVAWLPNPGSFEIHVMADALDDIDEADETNNLASEVIVVYSERDIIVNNANTPYNRGSMDIQELLSLRGYTLVEENGVLTFTNLLFEVLQTSDYQFNIIVKNNGQMILESGTMIYTDGPLIRIYLYDNSTLIIRDSIIQSTVVDIMAFGDSKIIMEEAAVNSRIKADSPTANVQITATNSTLSQGFSNFGGTSKATFTDVVTPTVMISDNAELTVYQWLFSYVRDGAGTGIQGSEVKVTDLFSGQEIPESPKMTESEGLALFAVLTDIITADTEISYLSFRVDAKFVYDSVTYTGNKSKTFTSYVKDRETNFITVEIFLQALKPDLTVNTTGIKFYRNGVEKDTVGIGETIVVNATVKNIGTAGTTLETQVVVKFYHKMDGKMTLIGQDIIETPMAAKTGSGVATITWIPKADEAGDNEEIWVYVDPDNKIPELQESQDNNAFTSVNVVRPPDLEVTSIRFDTGTNQNVDNTTESILVTISTTITNVGTDRPAAGVTVTVYDGFPDYNGDMKPDSPLPTGVVQIGTDTIAMLLPGTSQFVSFSWDTTGKEKGHSIYVYALDSTTVSYIGDQVLSNNNASRSFVVLPKPDIRPEIIPPQTQYLTLIGSDGTVLSGNPQIGQSLTLQATIFNYGQVFIQGAIVRFFRDNPSVAANQIGTNVTINIAPNSPINASVSWIVGQPDGNVEIFVLVNEDRKIVESDYTNNQKSTTFTVSYAAVNLGWTDPLKSEYDEGDDIQIKARITFTGGDTGLASQPFTIQIRNTETNDIKSGPFTGTTDSNGNIQWSLKAPSSPGKYRVEIELDYGGEISLNKQFKVIGETSWLPIPLWMLLLIIVLIVVIALVATVLMARLGMGKLVECGECGAFIYEGEKKCPKCGAVFETETAKCSECGAWIPADSKSCPDCGAIFAGLDKEKKSYIESMKGQYQDYVNQFKPEAKDELGPAMSDEEFADWWKASPKYVGFEEWLKREEEVKKGRIKSCPACNTVNPESAAICFKCGTVFQTPEQMRQKAMPPPAAPAAPPAEVPAKRMVPRAPPEGAPPAVVPKKVVTPPEVVPKKVVRPPTVVPKKVVRPPEGAAPQVVPKKVIKRPLEEEEQK